MAENEKKLTIALAGNPNCGKTTLFNSLTGSTAYVGNWPGVTVEKRSGTYKKDNIGTADIVDLPGIYSLSPYSPEEIVSRNFILDEKPDVIINVLDGTNLERNLYMTTQILEMDIPVVIAVNMIDAVEKNGVKLDLDFLAKKLNVPVVGISALKKQNLDTLMQAAIKAKDTKRVGVSVLENTKFKDLILKAKEIYVNQNIENPFFHAIKALEGDSIEAEKNANAYNECRKLDGLNEDFISDSINARYDFITTELAQAKSQKVVSESSKLSKSDKIDKVLTNKWAGLPIFLVVLFLVFHLTFSEDLFFLSNTGWEIGTFAEGTIWEGVFFADNGISSLGVILANALNAVTGWLTELVRGGLESINASDFVTGLLCDGVLGGVFAVAGFLPQILLLFLFFSIMEDSGYMARVAFILDRIFRRFGLSGRSVLPMIMGFGCGVPAMINTRTLNTEKEKVQTIRVIPFFACSAKLPILVAVSGAIVTTLGFSNPDVITYSMYVVGVIAAICCITVMHLTTLREKVPPFIMELPSYHAPQAQALAIHVWDKAKHSVKKLFTIILLSTIIVWLLAHLSFTSGFVADPELSEASTAGFDALTAALSNEEYAVEDIIAALTQNEKMTEDAAKALVDSFTASFKDGEYTEATESIFENIYNSIIQADVDYVEAGSAVSNSVLAWIGRIFQPIFTPCGFGSQTGSNGWVYSVAVINGLIAKENVISTFATLASSVSVSGQVSLTIEEFLASSSAEGASDVAAMINSTKIDFAGLYAFMAFNILTIPCFASVATARGELSRKYFWTTVLFWLGVSYLISTILYTCMAFYWPIALWVVALGVGFFFLVKYDKNKRALEAKNAEVKAA